MIWHFFEVWVLMLVAFAVGCPLGAMTYRLIAESPFAELQGSFADVVGDIVDSVKSRLGIGPVWRPEHGHVVGRQMTGEDEPDHPREPRFERPARPERLPAGDRVLMIADRSACRTWTRPTMTTTRPACRRWWPMTSPTSGTRTTWRWRGRWDWRRRATACPTTCSASAASAAGSSSG